MILDQETKELKNKRTKNFFVSLFFCFLVSQFLSLLYYYNIYFKSCQVIFDTTCG